MFADLAAAAAHDAGNAERSPIADEQHFGVAFAIDSVEAKEPFAGLRAAGDEAVFANEVIVQGVERLDGFRASRSW